MLYLLLPPELWWVSAIVATIVAFAISYLLFRGQRDELALDLQRRREHPEPDDDGDAENAALDSAKPSETKPGETTPDATQPDATAPAVSEASEDERGAKPQGE